jgi:predicted nucleic acid-binding protein
VIVVDSSVWIGDLRDDHTEAVRVLRSLDPLLDTIAVPDLVLLEVLRGARDEAAASLIERNLRRFEIVALGGIATAIAAARHYRTLRRIGITIRSSIDLLIGTFCIEHGAALLHHDRTDFIPMQRHLGLRCL